MLRENTVMLRMCRELGFDVAPDPNEPGVFVATLTLF